MGALTLEISRLKETRGGEKTQITTRLKSGNTFKKHCTHTVHSSVDDN